MAPGLIGKDGSDVSDAGTTRVAGSGADPKAGGNPVDRDENQLAWMLLVGHVPSVHKGYDKVRRAAKTTGNQADVSVPR